MSLVAFISRIEGVVVMITLNGSFTVNSKPNICRDQVDTNIGCRNRVFGLDYDRAWRTRFAWHCIDVDVQVVGDGEVEAPMLSGRFSGAACS